MAINIIIKGNPITIPEAGESPDWGTGVTKAIIALTEALNSFSGTYDIAPQVQDISSTPFETWTDITNLIFPHIDVRGAVITYACYRRGDSTGPYTSETGMITINYDNATGWDVARGNALGDAKIDFRMSGDTLQIKLQSIPVVDNHDGKVSFRAISVLNN